MKLIYEKGRKGNGDRILKMTTTNREGNPIEREPFSIYKIALLLNQLSINEWKINSEKIKRSGKFFFGNAVKEAIDMAEKGIDWALEENIDNVKKWCEDWMLHFENIEPELRRVYQSKLEDFKNEDA